MNENLQEIIFGSSNSTVSSRISRWVKSGRLRKLTHRVYTPNFRDSDEDIVHRNLYLILGTLFPGSILSHRSALEGGPTDSGHVFITCTRTRTGRRELPGICVHLLRGQGALENDMPFVGGLHMSSRPRAFLENLQISRSRTSVSKTLPRAAIENRLERICQTQGEDSLNQLRDQARRVAAELGLQREFQKLDKMIGAILRTRPVNALSSERTRARAMGLPYDPERLDTFNRLFSQLAQSDLPIRTQAELTSEELQVLAFFESYFSNYIEGTEFEIEEAREIVFENRIPETRPQDAHDIMGTYRIVASRDDMAKTPKSHGELVELLKVRHHTIMEARPEALPGAFKLEPNRAGETHFVAPELVNGTLLKGFEMYQAVAPGLAKAVFMMFLVAEVHPFVDGNGRVARTMMNAELVSEGLHRIIVPTVYRDDYLVALRALSRSNKPAPLIKALDMAQQFCAQIPLSSYDKALGFLTECNAFKEPDEGRLKLTP